MLRSHWSFANAQHSEPHEEDSHRETYVQQHWTRACPVHLIPFSIFIMIYLHNIADHPGANGKTRGKNTRFFYGDPTVGSTKIIKLKRSVSFMSLSHLLSNTIT